MSNVFEGITNIDNYGGAELLWNELLYRYGNFLVFSFETAKTAVHRMFIINAWKYRTLLGTEIDINPINDVDITTVKKGNNSKVVEYTGSNTKSGNITESDSKTLTIDSNLSENSTTEKEKNTQTAESGTNTLTLNTTQDTTGTKTNNLQKSETIHNNNYTDTVNRSDFVSEDFSLKPVYVETTQHTESEIPKTSETTDTGTVQETITVNNTGTEDTSLQKTISNSGKDTDTIEKSIDNTGTEETITNKSTTFNDLRETTLKDETDKNNYTEEISNVGFKSNPFELLNTARITALFSVIDVILKDTKNLILYL